MTHLFWFLHMSCGWMIDARMWGDKNKDAAFIKQYIDVYWLFWYNYGSLITWTVSFIYWLSSLIPIYSVQQIVTALPVFVMYNVLVQFGMSVMWDVGFTKHEKGVWVEAIPIWLAIPNPFSKHPDPLQRRWVIGFTKIQMIYLDIIRVSVLGYTCIT